MSLVGKKAPVFETQAVINGLEIVSDFKLSDYLGKKYVVLFFYPKDFTFVCPTELFAFQEKLSEFDKRNVQLIGCSTDTEQSHWGWLNMEKKAGGIQGVNYPVIADTNKTISYNYGVLAGDWDYDAEGQLIAQGEMVAYRGLFLIDLEGIVRHETVNDMPIGRNVEEVLRIVDAWQYYEKHGDVCPANWRPGAEAMKPTHDGVSEYLTNN
jgi:peroxiredoxin (alkyl hydroperoxide reductase subunit C)